MFTFEKQALERITSTIKEQFPDQILSVTAFGSAVWGDNTDDSDFDVLVVIKEKSPELESKIIDTFSDECLSAGVQFDPVIKTERTMRWEKRYHTPFYTNIEEEGVPL
ncbi:MAG: nucleotidyltransferase domain-containing protein [Spirochaetia bacterium]